MPLVDSGTLVERYSWPGVIRRQASVGAYGNLAAGAWFRRRLLPSAFCVETCGGAPDSCAAARELAADEYVQRTIARIVLSLIEDPDALERMWSDLLETVRARRSAHIDENHLLRSLSGHGAAWYAGRRGTQAGWSYAATQEFAALLRRALRTKVADGPARTPAKYVKSSESMRAGFTRARFLPTPLASVSVTKTLQFAFTGTR
jgi:hypothetical protein